MKKTVFLFALSLGSAALAQVTVETDPVGFVSIPVPAQSDAILGACLNRAAVFKGKVESISGTTITVAGTPGWQANQFVQTLPGQTDTFAVHFATGIKEGLFAKVSANSANSITVELASANSADDLSGVKSNAVDGAGNGDEIDILPYWTPNTLFGGVTLPDQVELYVYDNDQVGQNIAPSAPMAYFTGFGWFETIGFSDQSHRPINFGSGYIFRNTSGGEVTVTLVGSVPMSEHRIVLRTLAANTAQDQRITYSSPVPEALASLNLGAEDFDELFIFDNTTSGINKAPTPLVYSSGRWYNSISFADVTDTTTLQPGTSIVYRKAATASPGQFVWADLQSYLQ